MTLAEDVAEYLESPRSHLDKRQLAWLTPLGPVASRSAGLLYRANRRLMQLVFDLRVSGTEHLPREGAFILAPNHESSLDPFALAAALPHRVLLNLRWAGYRRAVLKNPWRRFVNRLAGVVPIELDLSALSAATLVLQSGQHLVWFPEGHRSQSGELQEFRPGIGVLMEYAQVPVVPVHLENTHENMPPGSPLPKRRRPISVRFGNAIFAANEGDRGRVPALQQAEELAERVRRCLVAMDEGVGFERVADVS